MYCISLDSQILTLSIDTISNEIAHFAHIFLSNMDMSLIIAAICLKNSICIAENHLDGSVSQYFIF